MLFRVRHYVRMKWMDMKLEAMTIQERLLRKAYRCRRYLRRTLLKTRRKGRTVTRRVGRAAKDVIIPSLPGVSKVQLPQPPTPRLLVSNRPPNDSESRLIVKAIEKAEAESKRWTELLDQRRATGHASRGWELVTVHRIGQANRFVRRHRALISPIRRIPTEILQEIFLWVAQSTQQAGPKWRYNTLLPWILGQICQSWRAVALDTASLWTKLPTIHLRIKNKRTNIQMQYLTELLRRSKDAPIDISIDSVTFAGDEHEVIKLLCRHAERWEAAFLCLPSRVLPAFSSIKGRLLALRTLTLLAPLTHRILGPIDIFAVAPLLTTAFLARPFSGDILLPYTQIKHYRERLTFGHMLNPAVCSPLLETLTILEITDDIVCPAITIPHLVKLYVEFEYRSQPNFFDHLILPAIEELRIVSFRGNLVPSVVTMLSKTSPTPLKTFSSKCEWVDKGELTDLLVHAPQLVALYITLPASSSDILNLASGYQNRPLAPLLETCEFYSDHVFNQDITKALNLLASSRCELGSSSEDINLLLPGEVRPLKNLIVHFDDFSTAHIQLSQLENWSVTPTSATLQRMESRLNARLPDLSYGYCDQPKKLGIGWNDKLGQILADIESVEVDDARDIYMSRVHCSLKIISNWVNSSHGNCAQRIMDKWQPSIERSLKDRHWTYKRLHALVYITNDSVLRRSPEDAITIAYGLKERFLFAEDLWPFFISMSLA